MSDALAVAILSMAFALAVIYLAARAVRRARPTRFRNPANGYVETVSLPGLWSLLFGVFYFAAKGLWVPAIFCVLFPPCWLVFPFTARTMVTRHYLRQGWVQES